MRTTMRRLPVAAALASGLATVAACDDDEPTGGSSGSGGGAGAFPVTVAHMVGSAQVKSAPKWIVALGEVDQDALLVLGVTPVGMAELTVPHDQVVPQIAKAATAAMPA